MDRTDATARKGLAMLEVVIVMACIATLLTMLIPALLHGRSAARRVHCQNNLKQIGLAITNYETLYGGYPPGYLYAPEFRGAPGQGFGWSTTLLPFLDQQPLAEVIDWSMPIESLENARLWQQTPSVFMCPAIRAASSVLQEYTLVAMSTALQMGQSSYAGSFGPGDMWEHPDDRRGVFSRNSQTRSAQIADGLSHTIAVGERFNGIVQLHATGKVLKLKTHWPGIASDSAALDGQIGHSVLFSSGHVPLSAEADERDAWSAHEEGAQFLMADGAVLQIPFSIDATVYRALSTRADGELQAGRRYLR